MNKIKTLLAIILLIICAHISGHTQKNPAHNFLEQETSAMLVLNNALYPAACLDYQGDIICSGIYWVTSYPWIAQKIDYRGNFLWPNETYGILITYPHTDEGDETSRPIHILPKKDGGAFFGYEYMNFLGRDPIEPITKFYFFRPVLQSVSPEGEILWGHDGITLTNMQVRWIGGANLLGLRYDDEGNVMVYLGWIDIDSLASPNITATYLQKIDPVTGELLLDSTGMKLLDERAWTALFSKCGNTYLFHRPWIMCVDKSGEITWDLDLIAGFPEPYAYYRAATNDNGDIFIIYEDIGGIRCRIFTANGEPVLQDTLIISGELSIFFNTPIVNWDNNKWVFPIGNHIYCVDRNGNNLWGNEGVTIPDTGLTKVYDINPVDSNNIMIIYDYYPGPGLSLKIQKINLSGSIVWDSTGIFVMEEIGTTAQLLPDSAGGAYVVLVERFSINMAIKHI